MQATAWLKREVHGLFNWLLPPACALCLEPLDPPDPDRFCPTCIAQIPPLDEPRCPICALPYPAAAGGGHRCQSCLQEKRVSFSGVTALGAHQDLLRDAVHRFKYRNDINLDRPLGKMLARALEPSAAKFDLLVPVPLHQSKLRQRGYNQSMLIARQLSRTLQLPMASDLLRRKDSAAVQKEMAARDRAKNVRGIFTCSRPLSQRSILLVDDVMTSGATARECSRTLLAAGAASIHVAVLSRAPLT